MSKVSLHRQITGEMTYIIRVPFYFILTNSGSYSLLVLWGTPVFMATTGTVSKQSKTKTEN